MACLKIGIDEQREVLRGLQESVKQSNDIAEATRREQQTREEQAQELAYHQAFGPYLEHKNRNPPRVAKRCEWFLGHPDFLNWKQEHSALLWVSADPGCGKSVLSRSIIDEDLAVNEGTFPSVCYFFFKTGSVDQQGSTRCTAALLHQLFSDRPWLVKHALAPYLWDPNISQSFAATWDILIEATSDPTTGEIICVVDALDECEEDSRELLIDALKRLYSDTDDSQRVSLKFFVTSQRQHQCRPS